MASHSLFVLMRAFCAEMKWLRLYMPVRVAQSSSPREMIRCCRMQTLPCLPGFRFAPNLAPYRLGLWLNFYETQSFIILEVLFQVPVFFLGVRGLWKRESPLALFFLSLFYLIDESSLAAG